MLTLSPAEKELAATFSSTLGAGERTCLALAISRQGMFASDDALARRVARDHGIPLSGSLGILALNTRHGKITLAEGNSLLEQLIDLGFRSPISSLDDIQ